MAAYFLIFILQLIGISLHVLQKVLALDKLAPDDSLGEVFSLFWKSDRITVFISCAMLALNLVGHYIIEDYGQGLIAYINSYKYLSYDLLAFALAFVLGYLGQRKIYQWLGKAEGILDKQAEKLEKIAQ